MQYAERMLANENGEVLTIRVAHPAGTPNPFDTNAFRAHYTEEKVAALRAAFNLVAPLGNWKAPINAVLEPGTDAELVVEAVAFMGGGQAKIKPMPAGKVRIVAPGYYAATGA